MTEPLSASRVRPWVRIGLIAIGVPNALAGLWAVIAPQSWFDNFPGWAPRLVAAEPPYNAHLATDAGAGLLASGLVLLVAAWFADRRSTQLAVVTFSAFAIPHTAYHVLNPAPGLTSGEDLQNAGLLGFTAVAAIVLFVAATRSISAEQVG
ncbi:MAG: hypothetical protein WD691_11810 [Acidimicrobiales bacterium]